jgi:hypothetical protein
MSAPVLYPPAAAVGAAPAERAVRAAASTVDPIGLSALMELAELQTRVDRKYFVPADAFRRLIDELGDDLLVLDIDGLRSFGYESVYFDTPDLSAYRAHLQRRRQRFKARTRTYTDSGLTMFEVKLAGARGETVKQRVPYPAEHRCELTDEALAHLGRALCEAYHQDVPAGLRPTLVTTYRRTTFVTRTGDARLTCDVAWSAATPGTRSATPAPTCWWRASPPGPAAHLTASCASWRCARPRSASTPSAWPHCTRSCRRTRGTRPCGATSSRARSPT